MKDFITAALPWVAVPEIQKVYQSMQKRWRHIHLRATRIGAWLSMLALQNRQSAKHFSCLLLSIWKI